MNIEDLREKIKLGEDSFLELKNPDGDRPRDMFADRIEIFSPGSLPNSLTLDEISERQFARNELVCTCLSRTPLIDRFTNVTRSCIMDRRGEGVPIILSATEKLTKCRPEYKLIGDSELLLTIQSAPIDNRDKLEAIAKSLPNVANVYKYCTKEEAIARLKVLIGMNPDITQAKMAEALGVSRMSIVNWLRHADGVIRRVGGRCRGHWEIIE